MWKIVTAVTTIVYLATTFFSNFVGDCDDVDVHELDSTVTKWSDYLNVGDPDRICSKCQAIMWNHERNNKSATRKTPTFSLCCKNGQIILEKEKQPPEPLASLLTDGSRFRHFKENIRMYNCMFAMSSTGGQIDRSINRGGAKLPQYGKLCLTPHLGGHLWQQYVVDAFTAIKQYRLDWIRGHQTTIRSDMYHNIRDALSKGDSNPENVGKATILPASFTGSKRYMNQYFKDAMAIRRTLRHPSLFLTMTTNTKLPEIQRMLKFLPGVDVVDAPDVVARVFKRKVDQLLDQIRNKNCFGRCIGVMHVIEFQKRGLPHAHMLIWLHPNDRPKTTEQIDKMVSAEIPDPSIDLVGYETVKNYMIHGPCGTDCVQSPCIILTHFDDCGFPIYKRRKTGINVKKKGIDLDNRYVVPYNRDLLIRFQCHTNLEIYNSSRSLKYLFKYCLKGNDNDTMCLMRKTNNKKGCTTLINPEKHSLDEVKQHLDGRYVCASEASWRIFGFDIHSRWPSIERLPIHLPNDKHVSFKGSQNLQEVYDNAGTKKSKLEAWFDVNKTYAEAINLTYSEFPSKFIWHSQPGIWKQRKKGDVIGRLAEVHSSSGELLYLRMLLLRIKGAVCFDDLKTVNGHVYNSFHEAYAALGILKNDQQWHGAIAENAHTSMPPQLRAMFVNILVYSPISHPRSLWEAHWGCMSDDILLVRRHLTENPNLCLSDFEIQNYALAEIEKLLNDIGSGGCGKTFLWQTVCYRLRSEHKIFQPVASFGIAAVLLLGGRTAHSRFHILLKLDENCYAGLRHGTDISELLQQTDLIIWDEAHMQHCHAFECVDRSLRDIMSVIDKRRAKKPFGGITIVFCGDFRQILPVILKASRAEVVCSTLNKSKLWESFEVFLLKQKMRLNARNTDLENKTITDFSKWQLAVGDGKETNISPSPDSGEMLIKIHDQYIVHTSGDPIQKLFKVTYPYFLHNISSHEYLRSRAIPTPTNIVVDEINTEILKKIPGMVYTYLCQDSIDDAGDDDNDFRSAFPVEYLNSISMPCIPKHELKLKVGVIVMLMRKLNQIMGLCNGTRMIMKSCRKNSIECEILCGSHVGTEHLIPRIEMIPSDTNWPFEFKRVQFPIQICYAMTINKIQGQSLDTVGLYLPRAAFSHGHIYVAISRVT
ncbi:uncharacterized protein LOC141685752 [Apium graveolens]|uniref:uncharacterized protein LOC141685752 n=1 Tax=Apium graveolens TaxID=4045 RepID=UPI003D7A9653